MTAMGGQTVLATPPTVHQGGLEIELHLAGRGAVWHDDCAGWTDGAGHAPNGAPGVHHGLAASHQTPRLSGCVLPNVENNITFYRKKHSFSLYDKDISTDSNFKST